MGVKVKFAKVKEGAIVPSKRDEDMGFDIYACFDEDYMAIKPHETKLIPTGIASACDPRYGFVLFERGSTGSKGMARRAGIVDPGYRGEWFVGLTNTTENTMFITKLSNEETVDKYYGIESSGALNDLIGNFIKKNNNDIFYPYTKAIAQALLLPIPPVDPEEISYNELCAIESERGMGALGSSNK
jgi:dUTP pyrophosphatase